MQRSIRLVLALLSIVLGVMLVRYTLDRRGLRDDQDQAGAASSPKTLRSNENEIAQRAGARDELLRAPQVGREASSAATGSSGQLKAQEESRIEGRQEETEINAIPATSAEAATVPSEISANGFSVVGQPFPVSESVAEACKPATPGAFRWEACDRVNALLVQIATEPRDDVWATAMEQQLRAYAEAQPVNLTIRALECRKTICFIETAAAFPGDLPMPDYRWREKLGLGKEYPVNASERDAAGMRWNITLFPFRRK